MKEHWDYFMPHYWADEVNNEEFLLDSILHVVGDECFGCLLHLGINHMYCKSSCDRYVCMSILFAKKFNNHMKYWPSWYANPSYDGFFLYLIAFRISRTNVLKLRLQSLI